MADNKLSVATMMRFVSETLENIVEKGENAGYQHFLLSPQCFPVQCHRIIQPLDSVKNPRLVKMSK